MKNGDSLWLKTYGGPLGDIAYRGKQLPDGGFIFTGTTRNFGNAGFDNTDIYVVRTDSEGEVIWQKGYGLGGYELGASVVLTPDGGFIIGGDREGAGFNDDTHIFKIDSAGIIQWKKNVWTSYIVRLSGDHY